MKILLFGFAFIICWEADAQRFKRSRYAKTEQIRLLAFNDTTRALADLFTQKRMNISSRQRELAMVVAVSGVSTLVGHGLLFWVPDPGITAILSGIVLSVGGIVVTVGAGAIMLIAVLEKNPYTLRKYQRLVNMQKRGQPLPEFYAIRIAKYMRAG